MAKVYYFGLFCLDISAETLFRGDQPVALGQRAVTLLRLLVERARAPVSKAALIDAAWPGLAIEDSNLTVQIAAIRRILDEAPDGAAWIETLPRRGYRYVGPTVVAGNRETAPLLPTLALPDRPSVAVLPFANLSEDSAQGYIADGMVEDIIAGLSRIKWLFVVARNSSFVYQAKAVDVKRAGRELGVRYLLQGSFRKDGGRVRVSAQMIEAETGGHLWTERFDRALDDVFSLQDEIALNVVGAIEPTLRRAEVERVRRKRPDSFDAYDLVLQAQADVYSGMPDRAVRAIPLLDRAIALDSTYALAHAFAAMCHHNRFLRGGLREDDRMRAINHAELAIEHGGDDALALTFAGFSIGMDGHNHTAAFAALDTALAVSPSSAITYILGGVILGWAGKAEQAIEWGERAMRLSPFDPWSWSAFHALALGHFFRARFAEASAAAQKAVHANPGHSISHMLLTASLSKLGRFEKARMSAAEVLRLQPSFRYSKQFAGVSCEPTLAAALGDALRVAGMPE